MIALEVRLNGKKICVAGAEDLSVLSATLTACGRLGKKTKPARPDEEGAEIFYSVGGLTARQDPKKDVHVRWRGIEYLSVGDVLEVKVLETDKADRAHSRKKADRKRPRH